MTRDVRYDVLCVELPWMALAPRGHDLSFLQRLSI